MVWIIPILDSIAKWLTKIKKNILSQIVMQLQTAILREARVGLNAMATRQTRASG